MPVSPDDIDDIAAAVADIYREGELAVLRQVGRHLERYPGAPTASVGAPRLDALGALRRSVASIQAGLQADGSRAIREGLAAAWRLGTRSALVDIPAAWWPRSGLSRVAEEARRLVPQSGAIEALATAIVRDVGNVISNILRDSLDAYRSAVAGGAARMLAGGQTRREATQAAWAALVNRGVTGFTDRANRRWRLSSYAEMAMRTASARAAVQGQDDRLATLGLDLVYISDHVQECELCRPWEGRILHRVAGPTGPLRVEHATQDGVWLTVDVAGTVPGARAAGLWHPNCRHSMSAYIPGVTRVPQGRPDPAGYEARMRQRAIERHIRKWKERQAAATTPESKRAAGSRVRSWQAAMRQHLDDHPSLKRLRYREAPGAGSTPPRGQHDPAGPIGPAVQQGLTPADDVQVRATPRPPDDTDRPEPPEVLDGQLTLDDAAAPVEDLAQLSDEDLESRVAELMAAGDYDSPAMAAAMAEMDRRDAEAQTAAARREEAAQLRAREREEREAAQHARMAELVEQGWDWEQAAAEVLGRSVESLRREAFTAEHRVGEGDRRSFMDLAREQYRLYIERVYVQAEDATRGFLLTPEGQAQGIDPMSLFSGPRARAERWASEELKRWWDAHGRMNFEEFVDQIEQGRQTGDPGRDYNR